MNRNSAMIKAWPPTNSAPCRPALMAPRIAAVLMPPSPDMNSSFGSEPCISRRTSSRKDISVMSSGLHCYKMPSPARRRARLSTWTIHFCQFRRRHSARRDGPVRSRTGNTTNGVVISARKKVPKKPMRRSMPHRPVRTQNTRIDDNFEHGARSRQSTALSLRWMDQLPITRYGRARLKDRWSFRLRICFGSSGNPTCPAAF